MAYVLDIELLVEVDLEAISGILFLIRDNLCMRFVTEVILRRSSVSSVFVSIVPSKNRTKAER